MENTNGTAVVLPSVIPGEAEEFFPRQRHQSQDTVANHYADMSAPLISGRAAEFLVAMGCYTYQHLCINHGVQTA